MSIIYDALKKVEASNYSEEQASIKKIEPRTILVYGLAAFFGVVIAGVLFNFFSRLPLPKNTVLKESQLASGPVVNNTAALQTVKENPQAPSPLAAPVKEAPLFVLSGIFFSDDEGYALINNQIVKEKDFIQGAAVKIISKDSVELESGGSIIKLTTNR